MMHRLRRRRRIEDFCMAKKKPGKKKPPPPWARDWPRCGDVGAWMDALLAVAEHVLNPDERFSASQHAIRELAALNEVDAAISYVHETVSKLSPADAAARVSWHLLAAELHFVGCRLEAMEASLAKAEAAIPDFKKKSDAQWKIDAIRRFRWMHGLLDPSNAKDEDERMKAAVRRETSLARRAANSPQERAQHVEVANAIIAQMPDWGIRQERAELLLTLFEIGDKAAAEQLLLIDDTADKRTRIGTHVLIRVGEYLRAIRRIEVVIRESLAELRGGSINAHFPAMAIERAITELIEIGEKVRARSLLREVLGEGESWILQNRGAFSSAVFRSLAKATLLVEGPKPARRLLDLAMADAQDDSPSGWRTSAIRENLELLVELAPPEEAINVAKTIRSHKDRRRILAPLLARAERWNELHEVINSAADAKEAADIIWWTKFVWRPAK